MALVERARAKVNLCLRVLGRRADGYHELESLVAFAALGDTLEAEPAPAASLTLVGPEAAALRALPREQDLVMRAAAAFADAFPGSISARFLLTKTLPVAAGIGGGSADAAAALRLLARLNAMPVDSPELRGMALRLGADVPVCLAGRACWMTGIGEVLSPLAAFPDCPVVLVNPRVPVGTAQVFARLDPRGDGPAGPRPPPAPLSFGDGEELLGFLSGCRNDLEAPAEAIAPVVRRVLERIRETAGCRLARMSGSGATCFGLYDHASEAERAAGLIRAAEPGWWVTATVLGHQARERRQVL